MFDFLRRMIMPIIIIVLVFFAALIVLQWGGNFSSAGRNNPNVAGVIDGEQISYNQYNQYYQQVYQNEVAKTNGDIPDERIAQLEDDAWNQLVFDYLIMKKANEMGIVVTDKDVFDYLRYNPPSYLQQSPSFQTDGKFDYQKYLNAMTDPQAAAFWNQVEPLARTDLLKIKMQQQVIQTALVSEPEIRSAYIDSLELLKLGIVNVPMRLYSSSPPTFTDEQLQQYYDEHKGKYKAGKRAVVSFVSIPKQPSDYDWEQTHARAMEIYDSAKAGADFAELARSYSDDPGSAANGGDLGWFARGRMVASFDSAAFAMKDGDISLPVRTNYGWHILKHLGYRTESKPVPGKTEKQKVKEAHVAHILIAIKPSPDTQDKWYRTLDSFITVAHTSDFQSAAEQLGLKSQTTIPFEKDGNIRGIGVCLDISNFAFDAEPGDISDVIDFKGALYVVQLVKRLPAGTPSYDEVQARVKQDLILETVKQMCHDTAAAIYSEYKAGTPLEKAAEAHNIAYQQFEKVNRGSFIPGIGRVPEINGAAFRLKEKGEVSEPIDGPGGTVILKLIERTSPDITSFTQKRDSVAQALLASRQRLVFNQWYDHLIKSADVKNYVAEQRKAAAAQ